MVLAFILKILIAKITWRDNMSKSRNFKLRKSYVHKHYTAFDF